jgi:hypothetical protein
MDIENIIKSLNTNSELIKNSVEWSDKNLKFEEKENTSKALKRSYNELEKIKNSLKEKPVVAVFGGSQVGKSYLVKSLLSEHKEPLFIEHNGEKYDFLSRINPPGGGAESTGLVTRFTIHNEVLDTNFPIKVKLLTPKDILLIILDSFYLDLNKLSFYQEISDIEQHLFQFENIKTDFYQNYLNEFDIEDCTKYFFDHFSKYEIAFDRFNKTKFFSRIGKIIEKTAPEKWSDVLGIMWNFNESLTTLFNKLIGGLIILDFEKVAYIEFEQILREEAILDVAKLSTLYSDTKNIKVKLPSNNVRAISQSLMTALISELILKISDKILDQKPFLEKTDLLDFPGARTRMNIDYENIAKESNIEGMLLRGKVSYLFNKYSDEMNITNLLFCIKDHLNDVNEIPNLLESWINKNIGNNPENRKKVLENAKIPPLFIVLTFFNNQLKFDSDNDSGYEVDYTILNKKWEKRFIRFFENEIVTPSRDWHKNWTGLDQSFKNFYLLRDFKYSEDSFEGFEQNKEELKIKDDRTLYLSKLKESFINYEFVKKHIDNTEALWDASTSLNQDGSKYIIQSLNEVASNKTKITNGIIKLNTETNKTIELLEKHIKSDEVEKIKNQKLSNLVDFQFDFTRCFTNNESAFVEFIEFLLLNPKDLYHLINQNDFKFVINSKENNGFVSDLQMLIPGLNNCTNADMVYEILMKEWKFDKKEMIDEKLQKYNIQIEDLLTSFQNQSQAIFYTDLILDYWKSRINIEHIKGLKLNLSDQYIDFLVEHCLYIIDKKEIRKKIIQVIDEASNLIEFGNKFNTYIAESACLIFNEVIINFDINLVSNEELSPEFLAKRNRKTEEDFENLFDLNERDAASIFTHKFRNWFDHFRESVMINAGVITYDTEANDRLIRIVSSFNTIPQN